MLTAKIIKLIDGKSGQVSVNIDLFQDDKKLDNYSLSIQKKDCSEQSIKDSVNKFLNQQQKNIDESEAQSIDFLQIEGLVKGIKIKYNKIIPPAQLPNPDKALLDEFKSGKFSTKSRAEKDELLEYMTKKMNLI